MQIAMQTIWLNCIGCSIFLISSMQGNYNGLSGSDETSCIKKNEHLTGII